MQRLGQAADVVVRLDRVRLLGLGAGRLDHVRDRSCPARATSTLRQLRGLALEHVDEQAADDLALGLGIVDAGERRQELVGSHRRGSTRTPRFCANVCITCSASLQAQQPVVDEHAGQPVADRAMDERRGDRRVDAAGQAEQHFLGADLRADRRDRLVDVVVHVPVAAAAADVVREARSIAAPCFVCVTSGWNCTRVEAARLVGHRRRSRTRRRRRSSGTPAAMRDLVAVAHPDVEQPVPFGVARGPADPRRAPSARARALRRSRTRAPCRLRPCRPAARPSSACRSRCRAPGTPCVHTAAGARGVSPSVTLFGPPDRMMPFGANVADEGVADVERMDLAVDVRLAQAARDELRVLRAEVEDQDLRVRESRPWRCRAADTRRQRAGARGELRLTRPGSSALP